MKNIFKSKERRGKDLAYKATRIRSKAMDLEKIINSVESVPWHYVEMLMKLKADLSEIELRISEGDY